jgi:hypothetical protein
VSVHLKNLRVRYLLIPSYVGNMRIITAIYLTCRPGLREEWMIGLESESDIEESAVRVCATLF